MELFPNFHSEFINGVERSYCFTISLYSATLLKVLLRLRVWGSPRSFRCRIMPSANKKSLIFSFVSEDFSCCLALAKKSGIILNKSKQRRHHIHISEFSFFPIV